LENGTHTLSAVYGGSAAYQGSSSTTPVSETISSQCASEFVVTVTNFAVVNSTSSTSSSTSALTLTPGQSGTATVSVIPTQAFVASLSAPAFVTISCSGLSDLADCASTPENVEILAGTNNQNAAVTSTMGITTYASNSTALAPAGRRANPVAWAFLLPGVLGLGGLAFSARRRRWLSRLSLFALVGLVTVLGTAACNPRYNYQHHGPQPTAATPAGTYTVTVTAQTSNGVSAVEESTSFVLTVK
jgi:hypothetical protein